ncbi:MAG TPA: hypothetical protein VHK63_02220 [Candidatus Limnocylindria bacterium]|nr:hypothetical protein [Candidatus Limnocylindria bacterium]
MIGILTAAVLVGGFSAGRLLGQLVAEPARRPAPSPTASALSPDLPRTDAPGSDIRELPRYPGSVRTSYRQTARGDARITSAAYAVSAGRRAVRSFYVRVFERHGWEVVDLGFAGSTWTFVVEQPPRQATLEIRSRAGVVLVSIAVTRDERGRRTEPKPGSRHEAARPPMPVPPQPDDAGEGDDGGDADDDDASDDGGSDGDD